MREGGTKKVKKINRIDFFRDTRVICKSDQMKRHNSSNRTRTRMNERQKKRGKKICRAAWEKI
jgi:hypothetical protein